MNINGICQLLDVLENGQFEVDATDELNGVLKSVDEIIRNGAKKASGSLTIKLNIVNEQGVVYVVPDLSSSRPKRPRGKSIYYQDENGELCTDNPNQPRLPLAEVKEIKREIKTC